ncbi:aldehyde dehydrogenase [Achaetomium macrosporum]|uniref:NADP-dependent glyceraldehyde-3-phosphate dehydrogenase n=1 Tax=Achaetomium macrosporum TaxID=79813 RepID=A0AAN7H7N4_9PEZI|nr:aldehyde dehydrogenase [Achaetomium macrosporum]
MTLGINLVSPVSDKLDWECQKLKDKFPRTRDDVPKVPKPQECLLLIDGDVVKSSQKPTDVRSPIVTQDHPDEHLIIGRFEMASEQQAIQALEAAERAYMYGRGVWAKMSMDERCKRMESFADDLENKTDEIAELLMWEIGKTAKDARSEVTRTVAYIRTAIKEAKALVESESRWQEQKGVICQIRHLPVGVVLASSPFNYPLNEAYTTFIPALLMGNSVIVRAPRNGATPHFPTLELFAKHFPRGTIQLLTGSGREIMGALVGTGRIDAVAFIGTASSAKGLLKGAPNPQRLRVMYEGEAKDAAILLPDADISVAVDSCVSGMTSFNGQRCTAIKMIWVHHSQAEPFLSQLASKIDSLVPGMPWDENVKITPLCEDTKPGYIRELITDALAKGAHIVNGTGGRCYRTLCTLSILAPVNKHMKIWSEEQFGPVTPVAVYSDVQEPIDWVSQSEYGLQCALFGYDEALLGRLVDALAYHVGRININTPDQRGPDVFPFTGRGNSALGILNATEALKFFSVPTMVAAKTDDERSVKTLMALDKGDKCSVLFGAN